MAKKNYTTNADGRSAEDKAMDKFAELMIEKISNLQGDWKKPWFSPQSANREISAEVVIKRMLESL